MKEYVKHLIQCKCVLLQYKNIPNPPLHKFVVFSEIDENGLVIPNIAQCQNCGAVHKVKEVGVSEILRKEDAPTLLTIDEIKSSLSKNILEALSGYNLELHQWMEIKWIFENEAWGRIVILTKDSADGLITGKYIQILGQNLWRFNNFIREESIAEKV